MGVASTLGIKGIGLGFLYNTFLSSNGGGLSVENFKELVDGLGFDTEFLDDGIVSNLIDGKEGPLSLLISSLTLLSGDLQQWGIVGSLAWMGVQFFRQYQRGELKNVFSAAGNGDTPAPNAPAQAVVTRTPFSHEAAKAAMDRFLENSVAQVGDQNQDITNGEATLLDAPEEPDGPHQEPP